MGTKELGYPSHHDKTVSNNWPHVRLAELLYQPTVKLTMPKGHAVQKSVSFTLSVSHAGVLGTAAGVAHDQAEADEEMSLQQRLILAGGSVLEGTSEMVDNEVISGAMEVGGRCLYILALFYFFLRKISSVAGGIYYVLCCLHRDSSKGSGRS